MTEQRNRALALAIVIIFFSVPCLAQDDPLDRQAVQVVDTINSLSYSVWNYQDEKSIEVVRKALQDAYQKGIEDGKP